MSKKLYALIIALVGVACATVDAFITYFNVPYETAISTVCTSVPPFVAEMLLLFVANETLKKKGE